MNQAPAGKATKPAFVTSRHMSALDRAILRFDRLLQPCITLAIKPSAANESMEFPPARPLSPLDARLSTDLMRINHAGEVSAQGLYVGQSLVARDFPTRRLLEDAATEEAAHISWCQQRLSELGGRPSLLDPFWYLGSLGIGLAAGALDDRLSLGFVAETERQVKIHLDGHLSRLPEDDERSRAMLTRMQQDEVRHGERASRAGGAPLPAVVRSAMRLAARVMTTLSSRL